jgi:hypothetical protein
VCKTKMKTTPPKQHSSPHRAHPPTILPALCRLPQKNLMPKSSEDDPVNSL